MAQQYVYPTAAEISEIAPELEQKAIANLDEFQMFPPVDKSTFFVRWIQEDNGFGMMHFRGLDGREAKVQRLGLNTFQYEPGVYGERETITERELTTRAIPTRPDLPIPIGDLVTGCQRQLIGREVTRIRYNIWTLLSTGTISIPIPGPNGPTIYTDTYAVQNFTSTVPISTLATSTPIRDMQSIEQLGVGHGTDFGAGATIYMNRVSANRFLNNSNASDFGGRRTQYGATLNSLTDYNNYFASQGLAKIKVVDDGFQIAPVAGPITNPTTQYQKYLANGVAVVVGARPAGQNVGEWQRTINLNNPGNAAGPYQYVKDYANGINAPKETPPKISVHRGFNGGLTLKYPNSIVVWTMG